MKRIILSLAALAALATANAEVKLSTLWGDDMVLQQSSDVLFWGDAEAGKQVTITPSWSDKSYTVKAAKDGKWSTTIPTVAASEVAHTITFSDGSKPLTLSNVLMGEVWLCMGQSNMELAMRGNFGQPILGAADAIAAARPSRPIRIYKMEVTPSATPQQQCSGSWRTLTPQGVANFSATAYFFADYLERSLGVPIGIINSSWGGSKIETWMSREWLLDAADKEYDFSMIDSGKMPADSRRLPVYCYNGMVEPMRGLKVKGMLWYQGEANRPQYWEYAKLLPSFVKGMRTLLGDENMPFFYAQIAPLGYPSDGKNERMRETMATTEALIPNAAMVCLTDAGEPLCIHPRYKQLVGSRFALLALGECYGMHGMDYRTPVYAQMKVLPAQKKITSKQIAIKFNYAKGGIAYSDINQHSVNLEIAGSDKVFYPAENTIIRDDEYPLRAWSPKVPEPVAVRYAFKPYAKGDIFNNFGIPLSTFRTDNWK